MIIAIDRSNLHMGVFLDQQELKDLLAGRVSSLKAEQEMGWQVELICAQPDARATMFRQGEGGREHGHVVIDPLR